MIDRTHPKLRGSGYASSDFRLKLELTRACLRIKRVLNRLIKKFDPWKDRDGEKGIEIVDFEGEKDKGDEAKFLFRGFVCVQQTSEKVHKLNGTVQNWWPFRRGKHIFPSVKVDRRFIVESKRPAETGNRLKIGTCPRH